MKQQVLKLEEAKTFPTSQNIYFDGKLELKNKDGSPVVKDVRVTVNPRWKGAYDEAIENATRCSQPSFNLYVQNMERKTGDYNGTGSTWARRVGTKEDEGSLHEGNFNFQGTQYTMKLERSSSTEPFSLVLTELEPVALDQL